MDAGTAILLGGGLLATLQGLQTLQTWFVTRRIERSVERVAQSLQPPPLPRSLAQLERELAVLERKVEFLNSDRPSALPLERGTRCEATDPRVGRCVLPKGHIGEHRP